MRFRSGQVELHRLRVDSATEIEAGDLVYLDGDDVKPASAFAWDTNLATTQGAFAAVFLGVAQQSSRVGETADISVDLSPLSVYEFDVDPSTFEVGNLLGPDNASDALVDQQLMKIGTAAAAIARAAEYRATTSATLRVQFASAFHVASANVNAALG
ncbi:MAG: hypothetical protein KF777_12550 [Planctomycetaceae bacterium]|nr:hypothetical protein [Planctomycetaceae bacterium]